MPERPVVIVQQSQTQWQNQDGCGCGACLGVFILLALIGALLAAMQGEYGLGWQIGSIAGVVILGLLIVAGAIGWADQKFGWGLTRPPDEDPPTGARRDPQDIINETENYGTATQGTATPERSRLARPVPHPDDPPVTEGTTSPDIYEQIRRLAELRDDGLISAEEFEAKKTELLKRL